MSCNCAYWTLTRHQCTARAGKPILMNYATSHLKREADNLARAHELDDTELAKDIALELRRRIGTNEHSSRVLARLRDPKLVLDGETVRRIVE